MSPGAEQHLGLAEAGLAQAADEHPGHRHRLDVPVGAQHQRRRVAAGGEAQRDRAVVLRPGVAEHHRREARALVAGGDGVEQRGVEQRQQAGRAVLEQAQRVPRLADPAGEHRGLDPLAAHVAEQEGRAALGPARPHDLVEVAADAHRLAGRAVGGAPDDAVGLGQARGGEALLEDGAEVGLLLVQRRGREGGTGARDVGGEQVLLGIGRVAVGRAGTGEHHERVDDPGDGHRARAQRRPRARGVEAGQRGELLGEPGSTSTPPPSSASAAATRGTRVSADAAVCPRRGRPAAELGGRPGDLVVVAHHEHGPGGQARHGQRDDAAGRPVEVQDAVQRAPGLGEERGTLLGGEQGVGAGVLAGDVAQEPGGVALAGLGRRGRRRPEHRAAAAAHVALALGVVDDGLEAARPRGPRRGRRGRGPRSGRRRRPRRRAGRAAGRGRRRWRRARRRRGRRRRRPRRARRSARGRRWPAGRGPGPRRGCRRRSVVRTSATRVGSAVTSVHRRRLPP